VSGCSRGVPVAGEGGCARLSQPSVSHVMPSGFYQSGEVLRHEFRVFNDTESVVRLGPVRTSCSCTTAELSRKEVRPGKEILLRMSLALQKRSGKQAAQCVLSDDTGSHWLYRISATSYPLLEFAKGGDHAYVQLGILDPGDSASGAVDVFAYADSKQGAPEVELQGEPSVLNAELHDLGVEVLPDGFRKRHERVLIELPGQTMPGLHKEEIVVTARRNGSEAARSVTATVVWQVKSLFSLEPSRVSLGVLGKSGAGEVHRTIAVKRVDGEPLCVGAVRATHHGIVVERTNRISRNETQVAIVVDTDAFAGPVCGEVVIATLHPAQPEVAVPVTGFR
jgi:uncharacterized protein DUF1573